MKRSGLSRSKGLSRAPKAGRPDTLARSPMPARRPAARSEYEERASLRFKVAVCFPGGKAGKPISPSALPRALKQFGRDCTVHGFRSTFRDWCAEQTNCPREICEMALAHNVGNAVERAYQRSKLFQKRAELMEAWGRFCTGSDVTVVALRASA